MAEIRARNTIETSDQRVRHFWRNLLAVSAWELIWGFGAACVAAPIVMALALHLTDSKALIGLIGFTQITAVPALLLSAFLNRRLERRRWPVLILHIVQVSFWGVIGAALLLPNTPPVVLFGGLVLAHAFIYLISGLVTAPTYELLSAAFGRGLGTATGIQVLVNRLSGVVGGIVAETMLAAGDFPANFGRVLLVGAAALTVSNFTVLLMIEPRVPPSATAGNRLGAYLRGLGAMVRGHRDYLVFLVVVAVLALMTVVEGFFTTFALERLGMDVSRAGLFTAIVFAATGVGGLSGMLGDRWGHRQLMLGALAAHALSTLAVLVAPLAVEWFWVGLACSGVATAAASIATTNLMVDFAPVGERGAYAAIGRLATLAAGAALTPLSGLFIDVLGYAPLFWISVVLLLAGIVISLTFRDPRHRPAL